ncbi:MAG: diguanylate cyclase [Campylobacterota bacterium]|nr:diguanylate cyclase [Campylobacterota bacterium]
MKRKIYFYIMLIFLIPSIGMLFYSGIYVLEKYNTLNNVAKITDAIHYVQHSEKLLNSLQKERGMTNIFLSSNGSTFKNKLKSQRENVDLIYSEFKLNTIKYEIKNLKHQEYIKDINIKYDNLSKLRFDIDKLNIQYKDSFKEYTKINNLLINSISYMLTINGSNTLTNNLISLVNIIKTKEHAGIERALLSTIITNKDLASKSLYQNLIKVISIQDMNIKEFLLKSNNNEINIFKNYLTTNITLNIERYRKKLLDNSKIDLNNKFHKENSTKWWDISTSRVNAFGKVADNITLNILNQLSSIKKDAKIALILSLIFWIIGLIALLIALYYLKLLMEIQKLNYKQIIKQKYINDILIQTNELILYEHTQQELFNEICNNCTKESTLSLAFVGILNENNSIDVVASSGRASKHLSKLTLSANPNSSKKALGLAGKAIIEDKNLIIDDVIYDGSSLFFEVAKKYELHSAAAYPIRKFNKTIGVIVFYAKDVNFFDKDIELLFNRMVTNISFGLEKIYHENVRKEEEVQLVYKAQHDYLTDLPNRFLFIERLNYSIKTKRRNNIKGAVIFIDLDNFKPINDNFGHHVGDLLLIKIANILKTHIRQEDTVARIGGDEFVILIDHLDGVNNEETTQKLLLNISNKIRTAIEKIDSLDNHKIDISASMGVVMFPDIFTTPDEIIKASDSAMYESKNSGKNKVIFYS